ncbi:MAG TPA: chemotaxis protein CheB [Ignavibacteriaceae bacterium]|jgi:two-component system chemotaxis response regulator CheB|nr:chemotaxis protein CheB [Ignavibacteriaceae bacterium]
MKIIVIGTSAGGIDALSTICEKLPSDFAIPVFIVWHISPESMNYFPQMLAKKTKLRVQSAIDNQAIKPGYIYTAPPNNHVLIEDSKMRVVYGPKENRFRPAIDPLFRSAAYAFGSDSIGILLSGMLNDGTSGLWSIKDRGGVTIVQDPEEAQFPDMPLNALHNVSIDYKISIEKMGNLLVKLAADHTVNNNSNDRPEKMKIEIKMVSDGNVLDTDVKQIGELSEFTCPECHGSLWQIKEGNIIRFRCRTGHAYSASALLEELSVVIEKRIWSVIKGLEEHTSLVKYLTEHLHSAEEKQGLNLYLRQAEQSQRYANLLRRFLTEDIIDKLEIDSLTNN